MTVLSTQIGPWALIPRWVIRHPGLTDGDVRLYAALADRAEREGQTASFSQRTLADDLGIQDVHTISRRMSRLEAAGAVVVTRSKRRDSCNEVNNYRVVQVEPLGVVEHLGAEMHMGYAHESTYPYAQKSTYPLGAEKRVEEEPVIQEPLFCAMTPAAPPHPPPRDTFEPFWLAYPARSGMKRSKGKAKEKWGALSARKQAQVMENLPRYISAIGAGACGTQDAHRWLTNGWEDFGPDAAPVADLKPDIRNTSVPWKDAPDNPANKPKRLPGWVWDQIVAAAPADRLALCEDHAEQRGFTVKQVCASGNRDPITFEPV